MTDTLEEIARETAAKLIPHTTSVHNVGVITDALREAAQSTRIPENVEELCTKLRSRAWEDRQHRVLRAQAADTIEQQAAEIERLTNAREAYFADAQKQLARAEAAEARIVELEKALNDLRKWSDEGDWLTDEVLTQRDEAHARIVELTEKLAECDDDSFRHVIRQRDEARAQVTALIAENAVAREILETLPDQFYSTCPEETEILKAARDFCSTPNTKAMRMVEVVKALKEWRQTRRDHAYTSEEQYLANTKLGNAFLALNGEQG